jgi:hypothetical protein
MKADPSMKLTCSGMQNVRNEHPQKHDSSMRLRLDSSSGCKVSTSANSKIDLPKISTEWGTTIDFSAILETAFLNSPQFDSALNVRDEMGRGFDC